MCAARADTLATITFQNFFNKYTKKAGMTGTAQTEEKEFRNIYAMDVIVIPTNRPMIRKDMEDAVYKTKKEKYKAVVDEVEKAMRRDSLFWWVPSPLRLPSCSARC